MTHISACLAFYSSGTPSIWVRLWFNLWPFLRFNKHQLFDRLIHISVWSDGMCRLLSGSRLQNAYIYCERRRSKKTIWNIYRFELMLDTSSTAINQFCSMERSNEKSIREAKWEMRCLSIEIIGLVCHEQPQVFKLVCYCSVCRFSNHSFQWSIINKARRIQIGTMICLKRTWIGILCE